MLPSHEAPFTSYMGTYWLGGSGLAARGSVKCRSAKWYSVDVWQAAVLDVTITLLQSRKT